MEWNGEESDRASKSPVERERERGVLDWVESNTYNSGLPAGLEETGFFVCYVGGHDLATSHGHARRRLNSTSST